MRPFILHIAPNQKSFTLKEKVMFWKKYSAVVKKKIQNSRNTNVRRMKEQFIEGMILLV